MRWDIFDICTCALVGLFEKIFDAKRVEWHHLIQKNHRGCDNHISIKIL